MRWEFLIKAAWVAVFALIALAASCALIEYRGSAWVYMLFTALSTAVLFVGFGRRAIFFDAFIGVLLWIGFWLKFTVQTVFFDGRFNIPVGDFDSTPESFDKALLVVCCALAAVLLARWVRQRWVFSYPEGLPEIGYIGLFRFYRRHRAVLLYSFMLGVLLVCVANAWLGIYQRGQVARVTLPFGLNGVFAWLLMFGMASVSTLILRFEFELNRERYWIAIGIALLETTLSNISLWSRGMILNGSSLLYGAVVQFKCSEPRLRVRLAAGVVIVFCALFAVSVYAVNYMRALDFHKGADSPKIAHQLAVDQTSTLFLDRWVGMEGVMSVVGGGGRLSFGLFEEALSERFDTSENSFYDKNFIDTPYDNSRNDGLHFVSLPGYIAFLFYSGSYAFLFCAVFVFSMLAVCVELMVYYLGGRNLVLCALIAQVVAFRYTSFGYVPMQSYLLFGSVFLNLLILFFFDRLARVFARPELEG